MNLQRISMAALLLVAVSTAGAGIVPIGEFTGELYEGFEGIIPPGSYSGPMPIFNGAATFDDQYSDPWITFNLANADYEILAYNGNYMGLTPTGWTNFVFDTPVLKFGGQLGIVNVVQNSNVTFYDEGGAVIDVLGMDLQTGTWTWCGWESDIPIASIAVHANEYPGATCVFDEVVASYVPEPGALGLFAVCVTFLMGRRR